jgi:hypothetical protein
MEDLDYWGPKEWEDFDSTVKAVGRMIKITNIFENETLEKI